MGYSIPYAHADANTIINALSVSYSNSRPNTHFDTPANFNTEGDVGVPCKPCGRR